VVTLPAEDVSYQKPVLVFRADAEVAIGTGHVMRCLALAQAWQDAGGRASFLTVCETQSVADRLKSEGMEVIPLLGSAGSDADARQVSQLAHRRGANWVVLDGYHFGASYEGALKATGTRVLRVDDAGFSRPCTADMILNSNSDASESLYPNCDVRTRLLLGSRYVLLRREFLSWRDWERKTAPKVRHVLVAMGGSDPDNLTLLAMRALRLVKVPSWQATVVAGGSNPHLKILRAETQSSGAKVTLREAVSNMPELMAQSDLAIIAAGGTLWELLSMACPVLSFGRDPVQRRILDDLQRKGIVKHLGDPAGAKPAVVAEAIDALADDPQRRAKMARVGRQQVDGAGARRVCELLVSRN